MSFEQLLLLDDILFSRVVDVRNKMTTHTSYDWRRSLPMKSVGSICRQDDVIKIREVNDIEIYV